MEIGAWDWIVDINIKASEQLVVYIYKYESNNSSKMFPSCFDSRVWSKSKVKTYPLEEKPD